MYIFICEMGLENVSEQHMEQLKLQILAAFN